MQHCHEDFHQLNNSSPLLAPTFFIFLALNFILQTRARNGFGFGRVRKTAGDSCFATLTSQMNVDSARIWDSPVISAQSSSNPQLTHEPQTFLNQQHMSTDAVPRQTYQHQIYAAVAAVQAHGIPTEGPATHPDGPPRDYSFTQTPQQGPFIENNQPQSIQQHQSLSSTDPMPTLASIDAQTSKSEIFFVNSSELFTRTKQESIPSSPSSDSAALGGPGANHYPSSNGVPRLPPILQVEKQQVTTSATQLASASRRRNEAHFQCPVPGCGSTFTRRFNLRGQLTALFFFFGFS